MRTENNIKPTELFQYFTDTEDSFVIFNDLSSIEESEREGEKVYTYQSYQLHTSAPFEYVKEHAEELLKMLKAKEYESLAQMIREKRNKLLLDSDKFMTIDRLNLDTSSAIKFLASLKNIFNNSYTEYRQKLRDITEQPGFPYDVEFPDEPKE